MNLETFNVLIGALLPPVIQIVNQKVTSSSVRYVISVVACLVLGAIATAIQGQLDLTNALMSGGIVFTSAQSFYQLFWNKTDTGRQFMLGK